MNLVRILQYLVILNGVGLALQSVRIIAVYSSLYTVIKGPRSQLPLHVWLIATSYLIYVFNSSYLLLTQPTPNALQRVLIYGIAGGIGQYALWHILDYEKRKITVSSAMAHEETHDGE